MPYYLETTEGATSPRGTYGGAAVLLALTVGLAAAALWVSSPTALHAPMTVTPRVAAVSRGASQAAAPTPSLPRAAPAPAPAAAALRSSASPSPPASLAAAHWPALTALGCALAVASWWTLGSIWRRGTRAMGRPQPGHPRGPLPLYAVAPNRLEDIDSEVRVLVDGGGLPSLEPQPLFQRQAYRRTSWDQPGLFGKAEEEEEEAEAAAVEQEEEDVEEVEEEIVTPEGVQKVRRRRERGEASSRVSFGVGQQGFVSIQLKNIMLNYGTQEVLKDATWEVKTGERVGLVGANGGGKSSLLRMLMGELEPSSGEIIKSSPTLKLAFLRQEFYDELDQTRTLKDELISVFAAEMQLQAELQAAEAEIEQCTDDPDRMQEVIERVTRLQLECEKRGVSLLNSKVEKAIQMMGFSDTDASLLVSAFSGGWKMRIGLGKVLLQEPNILLLDEPTNHLDLETVEWLERFLQEQSLPMVIVSHDREFLNQVATKIVDCDGGVTTSWEGNYEAFMRNKAMRLRQWEESYEAQQKFLKEAKIYINSNKMNPNKAAAVAKKERDVEAIMNDPAKLIKRPPISSKAFVFRFPDAPRLQENVTQLENVTHGYNGTTLFEGITMHVQPGERIAFLGPNGAGKSTLLRLILGLEAPSGGGTAGLAHHTVAANYFEQNQANALDLTKTVLESVQEMASVEESENNLRALLGKFLFKGDTVYKKVAALSGGEKTRLALCRMMLRPANVIVLDEPTNHLDIPAKEMLEEALQHYDGTVLIVSHDRYFVSQTATTIVELKDKGLVRYAGDYRYYMEQNAHVDEKVSRRYLSGSKGIQKAKVIDFEQLQKERQKEKLSRHFKRDGNITSGNKNKGVKNAKRMQG